MVQAVLACFGPGYPTPPSTPTAFGTPLPPPPPNACPRRQVEAAQVLNDLLRSEACRSVVKEVIITSPFFESMLRLIAIPMDNLLWREMFSVLFLVLSTPTGLSSFSYSPCPIHCSHRECMACSFISSAFVRLVSTLLNRNSAETAPSPSSSTTTHAPTTTTPSKDFMLKSACAAIHHVRNCPLTPWIIQQVLPLQTLMVYIESHIPALSPFRSLWNEIFVAAHARMKFSSQSSSSRTSVISGDSSSQMSEGTYVSIPSCDSGENEDEAWEAGMAGAGSVVVEMRSLETTTATSSSNSKN